ncbi:TonB-dependent receptor [Niveispirillum sp. KHB5.9]|uniref:TonB-dependent receptor n=1 Tax=Niveispirillum sp. KHB5.9 TaxID=3400269 RepID=UPI003A89E73C
MSHQNNRVSTRPLIAGLLLGATALTSLPAFAQVANDGPIVLEEIIVTAQKRAQRLQDVPASVAVVAASTLDNRPGTTIEGLQTLIPSLNFRKGGTSLDSSLFLRGVGTINFAIAAESSVAFVLDGVVLGRAGEAFGDLYDVERIEVLRGPQGTLFGKNASAGVVNLVTKRPGDKFGGTVELTAAEGSEYKGKVAVDLPLSDTVRARLTGFTGTYDGNITNLYTADPAAKKSKVNGYDRKGVRGVVEWDASDALTWTFIADYRKADDDSLAEVIGTSPVAGANQAALLSLLSGIDLKGDKTRQVRHNEASLSEEEGWGFSAQADYSVGDHTITSITAWREWDIWGQRDGDWLDRTAPYVGTAFAQLHDYGPQDNRTFSQELRIASPSGQTLEYVAGAYYANSKGDRTFTRDTTICTASTLAIDSTGQRPCLPGASNYVSGTSSATFGSKSETIAGFAQGTLRLTDQLSAIAGLRLTHDKLEAYHNRVPSQAPIDLPGIRRDLSGWVDKASKDNVSGKAGLSYKVTNEVATYATYSRGYKGPAFNVFFNQAANQRNLIKAETVDAYEAGVKSELFDRRALVNIAGFWSKYDNFQANNFDTLNGVVITRLTNAGEVSTKGIEIDSQLRVTEDFNITAGLAYTDAQIEKFRDATGVLTSARKGEPLPLAPKWKLSVGGEYTIATDNLPVDFHLNANYAYTSSQFSDLGNNPLLRIHSYDLVNVGFAISDKEDRYRLSLFVNNLFDQSFPIQIAPGGPGSALRYVIPREADRYAGVSLRVKFGE